MMLARGALISMVTVIFVLPGWFMLLDGFIEKTSIDFLGTKKAARRAASQARRIGTASAAAAAGSNQTSGTSDAPGVEAAAENNQTSGSSGAEAAADGAENVVKSGSKQEI